MKKILLLVLCCTAIVLICACSSQQDNPNPTTGIKTPVLIDTTPSASPEGTDANPIATPTPDAATVDPNVTPVDTAYNISVSVDDVDCAKKASIAYYKNMGITVTADELTYAPNDHSIYSNTYGAHAGDVIAFCYTDSEDRVRAILLVRDAEAEFGFTVKNEGF